MKGIAGSGAHAVIVGGALLAALGCAKTPLVHPAASPGAPVVGAPAPRAPAPGAAALQLAQAPRGDAGRPDRSARAHFVDQSGQRVGDARLQQTPHGVLITANLEKMPAGVRGFHIHETGRCTPTFEAAGDHFNPAGREHGFLNPGGAHAGDLPNIHVPESGRLAVEVLARDVTLEPDQRHSLLGDAGTALVIHERPDDYGSQPSGEAGGRIACAVIEG